jgi:hypothetical protein
MNSNSFKGVMDSRSAPETIAAGPTAVVLCSEFDHSPEQDNLEALLGFFGVPVRRVSADDVSTVHSLVQVLGNFCVLSSAAAAAKWIERYGGTLPPWIGTARSVYLYGFDESPQCQSLLRLLTGHKDANIRGLQDPMPAVSITDMLPEMCGPMSGLRIALRAAETGTVFYIPRSDRIEPIVTRTDRGTYFVRVVHATGHYYLNACANTIDIREISPQRFDVRGRFLSTVPATMFVKHAFHELCPTNNETRACLIVDDPTLRPRYGFLDFSNALKLMDVRNFTTTVAFIPWSWRRTSRDTVDLFRRHPGRFSLAVHGCDHTASEFATRSTPMLNRRIKTAVERMDRLTRRTSLQYEKVMVFPQGRFSWESGYALKLNGFMAAANSEVTPFGDGANQPLVADVWDIAIMKYGTFPIFTRRYPSDGIENFAFDGLLGKPCLIVTHHELFKGGDLGDFIERLNSLRWNLTWGTLGTVIRQSYSIRRRPDGLETLRMYGTSVVLEHVGTEPRGIFVLKQESDARAVAAVTVNGEALDWVYDGGDLKFVVTLPSGNTEITVKYTDQLGPSVGAERSMYIVKAGARRYLSEARDNYLSYNSLLSAFVRRLRADRSRPDG